MGRVRESRKRAGRGKGWRVGRRRTTRKKRRRTMERRMAGVCLKIS